MKNKITKEEAIELSLKKWQNIVKSPKYLDLGSKNCGLCQKYRLDDQFCDPSCPVVIKTKKDDCEGTIYKEWIRHLHRKHGRDRKIKKKQFHRIIKCKECLRLSRVAVKFLKELKNEIKAS